MKNIPKKTKFSESMCITGEITELSWASLKSEIGLEEC